MNYEKIELQEGECRLHLSILCCDNIKFNICFDNKLQCPKCKNKICFFEFLKSTLNESDKRAFLNSTFEILNYFGIADVIKKMGKIKYDPFKEYFLDIDADDCKILQYYFTIQETNNSKDFYVAPLQFLTNDHQSFDGLSSKIRFMTIPIYNKKHPSEIDIPSREIVEKLSPKQALQITTTLYKRGGIIEDHIVDAAECYYNDNTSKMIYHAFTAIELKLSEVLQLFWKNIKKLTLKECEELLDRVSIDKKINYLLNNMCEKMGFSYEKDKKTKLNQLREYRNKIVHKGKPEAIDKKELFAITCWHLVLLNNIETSIFRIISSEK